MQLGRRRRLRVLAAATVIGLAAVMIGSSTPVIAKATTKATAKKTTTKKKTTKKKAATTKKAAATTKKAAPAAAPSGSRAVPNTSAQGITNDTIKVGVIGIPINGIETTMWYKALLARWGGENRDTIHGRTIKFVYDVVTGANPTATAASQRQICIKQATKDKVAFSMGTAGVAIAAVCMTKEYGLPFLGAAGIIPSDEDFEAVWPLLFFDNMTASRELRNWPHWAKANNYLAKNAKIGVFGTDDPTSRALFDKNFKPQLQKLGYKVDSETYYRDASSIPLGVQRFKAQGVDVVFFTSNTGYPAYPLELAKQNYNPITLLTDWDSTALASSGVIRDFPDSYTAFAMTHYRRAEDSIFGNPPAPPQRAACDSAMYRYGSRTLVAILNARPTSDQAEASIVQHICDQGEILQIALRAAGRNPTTGSLVAGMETVKGVDNGQIAPITFTPTKHDGADVLKTMAWNYQCDCWAHDQPFRSTWVD